jgi:hypothetical protein
VSEILDLQVYSLLGRLHEARDEGCRRLREAAASQAHEIVAAARHRARQRVKEAVSEKRRQVAEHCRQVRVELETRRRQEHFDELGRRLAEGLDALPTQLAARWARPGDRRTWWRQVLDGAGQVLAPGRWTVLVAPGPGPAERRELAATASRLAGEEAVVEDSPDLAAGLVIAHDGARYDGSPAGLMANANAVQAALLAELAVLERGS